MEKESSKIHRKDKIFIAIVTIITISFLTSGVYLFVTNGSPGMQMVVFMLGGILGIALISPKLKKRYMIYVLYLMLLIILSIYAWTMNIDFELKFTLGLFWFIMIYLPFWYLRQNRITNYFDKNFEDDLKRYFTDVIFIEDKGESFIIERHPYINGDYEEGYIGDRVMGNYKDVDFDIYEYHIQGKKDVWQGSILEINSITSDDVVITGKTISSYRSYPNIEMIEELMKSYNEVSWIVVEGKLTLYINVFKPIFDTKVGEIKKPVDQIRVLLEHVIEILECKDMK